MCISIAFICNCARNSFTPGAALRRVLFMVVSSAVLRVRVASCARCGLARDEALIAGARDRRGVFAGVDVQEVPLLCVR